MTKLNSQRARELGRKGGKAKAAGRLTLSRVEDELGALQTIDDAERWLARIGMWAAAGMMSGAIASACVRAVEVWLKAQGAELERELVEKLRARLEELEAQVKRSGLGVMR